MFSAPRPTPSTDDAAALSPTTQHSWAEIVQSQPMSRAIAAALQRLQLEPTELPALLHALLQQLPVSAADAALRSWLDALLLGSDAARVESRIVSTLGAKSGGVCAAQFRPGEPAYMCTSCASDPTCVQCVACFKLADHSAHADSVRMINASGGGCCDCGDSSSWKEEGTCTRHKPDAARPEPDITPLFSAPQLQLMRALMSELVRITSLAVGCSESGRLVQLWPVLFLQNKCVESTAAPPTPATHTHLCLLLNDDVHSFDQVMTQLQRAIGTSETEGNLLANSVHGCGRALAFVGSLSRASAVGRKLAEIGLGVEVHPVEPYVLILQETRLQALMEWMAEKAKLASFFLNMQGEALMQPRVLPQQYHERLQAQQEAQQAAAKAAAPVPSSSVDASPAASATAAASPAAAASEPSANSSVASGDAEFDLEYMRHLAATDLGGDEQPEEEEEEEHEENEDDEEEQGEDEDEDEDESESVDSRGHTAAERAEEAAFIAGADIPMLDAPPPAADPLAAWPAAAAAAAAANRAAAAPPAAADAAAPTAAVEDEVITRILQLLAANGATVDDLPPNMREPIRAHLRQQASEEERKARQEEEEEMALAGADQPEEEPEDLSEDSVAKAMTNGAASTAAASSSSTAAAAAATPSTVSSSAVSPVLHIDSWLLNSGFLSASLFKRLSGLTFTLFSSASWKLSYAHRFLRYFPTLVDQWCLFSGGLDHSTLDFAVQIFTIPAIALQLTQAEPSAYRMFTATIMRFLQLHATRSAFPPYLNCSGLSSAAQNPFSLLMNDFSYLLRCPAVPHWLWTQRPTESFASWSEVLAMQEGMDPNTLKKHVHVVNASNTWQHAFTLAIRSNNVSLQMLHAYSRMLQSDIPASQLGSIVRATLQQCELSLRRLWRAEKLRLKSLHQSTSADASIQGVPLVPFSMRVVSFHTPLARFVSELLLLLFTKQGVVRIGAQQAPEEDVAAWNPRVDLRVSKSESRKKGEDPFVLSSVPLYLHCIDASARALALLGHVAAGLWVLNGESVANQRFNIERREVGTFFLRADLTALQLSVAFTSDQDRLRGPWCFVNVLLRRFGLGQYLQLSSDTSSASYSRSLRTALEWQQADKLFPVVEAFMRYLLTILTDRDRIGVQSRAARARAHMVHKLLLKPCTFSALAKCAEFVGEEQLGSAEAEAQQKLTTPEIKVLVQSVADFSAGSTRSADSAGQFTIKPAALADFNPYWPEFSSDQRQVAESNYLRLLSEADAKEAAGKSRASINHIYPPLIQFAPFVRPEFRALNHVMLRPECSELCFRILRRYMGTGDAAADKPSSLDSKPAMQAALFGYTPPPKAGNLRGTHERLVTHVIYLMARGAEEARRELSEAEADSPMSAGEKQESIDRVRGFLAALLKPYPAAYNQPVSSLLTLLCQLNFTALSKRENGSKAESKTATPSKAALKAAAPAAAAAAAAAAASTPSSSSSGAPSRVYSDWIFALQQPLMAHTIQQLMQVDMQLVALDSAAAASAPSYTSASAVAAAPSAPAAAASAYSSSSTLLRSIVSDYGVSPGATGESGAASADGGASDADRENRAARLKRGLKIRRRITRDMRKRLEAAAAAFKVDLPKKKSKATEASSAAAGAESAEKAAATTAECIVCRASTAGQASGFITWMQPSTLHHLPLLTPPSAPFEPRQRVLTSATDSSKGTVLALSHRALPLQIAAADFAGDVRDRQTPVVVKSCNHLIHLACLDSYTASLWQKLNAGQAFEGMQCVDLNKGEFCCPLCRQLANCIVPAPLQSAISEFTPATNTSIALPASHPPVFQLTRVLASSSSSPTAASGASDSEWIVRRARLQSWVSKTATNPQLMSQAPPRPPASLFPSHASLRTQEGLLRSFAEQIAKQTSEQDRSAPKRTGPIDLFGQIRFMLGTLTATARGIELGARLSPHAITMMRTARKTPPLSIYEALSSSDVLVLSAMIDGLALLLYGSKAPASGSSKPDALLKHVRSTWTSLVRLFAGDAMAAAPSESASSSDASSSANAMVDASESSDCSSTDSAFISALSAGAELRGNTPMVDRLRQLMGRISSGASSVTSMRPHQLRHEDDESCLPQLSSRDLLQEDPFTLLVRCVVSQGYAVSAESSALEIRSATVLLWHLSVFQLATHLAFATQHDNQHAYAAEVQREIQAAWQGPSRNQSASAVAQAATVKPVESESLTASFQSTIHALQLTRSSGGAASSSSAAVAASCVCCKPSWETVVSFLLPFLRCCVVLFRAIHFLPAPTAAAASGAQAKQSSSMSDVSESSSEASPLLLEYRHLLSVLQLPDLDDLLTSDSPSTAPALMQPLIAAFAALHPASVTPTLPLLTGYAPACFVRLPLSYDGLFQSLSDPASVCMQCGTAPKDPALCLVCGRLLCAKSACCAESGRKELSHHADRCCPGNGHYLLLRESSVTVLSQGLMHSAGSCYADRENETDILLRRGKPLFRSEDRLENLRAMFATQGAVTSFISRARGHRHMYELGQRNAF